MKKVAIAVSAVLLVSISAAAQKPEAPSPPALVVSGSAQVLANPDEAVVRLGIVRQANTAQSAQDQANAIAQEILGAIEKAGISRQQIQTSRLVLTPIYAPRNPESRDAPRIVAYNASNTVSVRIDNLSLVGPAIDAGLRAGANQLEGVRFGLRNDLPVREQALKQAVTEARSKAQAMAEALRVGLVEVLEVTEGGVSMVPFQQESMAFAQRSMAADRVDTPVSPGQLEISASVTIRFRIAPK